MVSDMATRLQQQKGPEDCSLRPSLFFYFMHPRRATPQVWNPHGCLLWMTGAAGRNRTHDPLVRSLRSHEWGHVNQRLSGALNPHFVPKRMYVLGRVAQKSRRTEEPR